MTIFSGHLNIEALLELKDSNIIVVELLLIRAIASKLYVRLLWYQGEHGNLNKKKGLILTSSDVICALKGREDERQRRAKETAERSSLRAERAVSRYEARQESLEKTAEGQHDKERSLA